MEKTIIELNDKQKLLFGSMRGCNYDIVSYLTLEDILNQIQVLNPVYYAVSPLHDLDIKDNGEHKKPHYHIVLCFGTKKRGTQLTRLFNTTELRLINTGYQLKGSFNYLTHDSNDCKGKVKYEKFKLITNNLEYFENLDDCQGTDNSFDIIDRIIRGCSTRDMVKLYGKDFIYHRKDYLSVAEAIQYEERANNLKLEIACDKDTGELIQLEF